MRRLMTSLGASKAGRGSFLVYGADDRGASDLLGRVNGGQAAHDALQPHGGRLKCWIAGVVAAWPPAPGVGRPPRGLSDLLPRGSPWDLPRGLGRAGAHVVARILCNLVPPKGVVGEAELESPSNQGWGA